jgi:hypothetical protein
MKPTVKNNREKLTTLTDDQIDQIIDGTLDVGIRVGFELEFQALNGKRTQDFTEGCECLKTPDLERLKLAALNMIETNFCRYLSEHLATIPRTRKPAEKAIRTTLTQVGSEGNRVALLSKLAAYPQPQWKGFTMFLNDCEEKFTSSVVASLNPEEYLRERCICDAPKGHKVMKKHIKLPSGTLIKEDGSVKGGEITTDGPQTVATCLNVTREIFDTNDLTVDEKCSYHIHFSVAGMQHSYSNAIQSEGMRYFIEKMEREGCPDFIHQRFNDFRFFVPELATEKYTFINYCEKYRTWEFRVFGNVSNVEDAKWCYKTLIETMRHVYKVLNGEIPSLRSILAELTGIPTTKVKVGEFYESYGKTMMRGERTLAEILEEVRLSTATNIDIDTSGVA